MHTDANNSLNNTYCEKCGKLVEGIFAGDPAQILCQCNAPELFTLNDKRNLLSDFYDYLSNKGLLPTIISGSGWVAIDEFLKEQRRK